MSLKKLAVFGALAFVLAASNVALARNDIAPAPRRMPRTPVHREKLVGGNKTDLPPSRIVTGEATVIDTERLKINNIDMRLFGVVPPQLSATFGPQARAVLDSLTTTGAVSCAIRDRERDGRFLATCRNAAGADLALELLRRGLAVAARGSLRGTELDTPYVATEQVAQGQKLGLWSVTLPLAASATSIRQAVAHNEAVAAAAETKVEAEVKDPPALDPTEEKETIVSSTATPETNTDPKTDSKAEPIPVSVTLAKTDLPEKDSNIVQEVPKVDQILPFMPTNDSQGSDSRVDDRSFFERYQLLVTGLLMLLTALGVIAAVFFQRWHDKREEVRSVAAALRGELMAARAVCLARLSSINSERDERNLTWPRIRTLVFQAYVGRIGSLGSVLARQIASIYGQASDYFAYYGSSHGSEAMSKRKALKALVGHIEEVLPKLATIEERPLIDVRPQIAAAKTRLAELPSAPLRIAKASSKVETKPKTEEEQAPDERLIGDIEQEIEIMDEASAKNDAKKALGAKTEHSPLWDSIRKFATERLDQKPKTAMEDHLPDYSSLSEDDELEAIIYGENLDDIFEEVATDNKSKKDKVS